MTATNPLPLANPFSERMFGNFNVNKAARVSYIKISKPSDPRKLTVPESRFTAQDIEEYQRNLTVPNQDVPMTDSYTDSGMGFIGNSSLLRLFDGSIIDLKTRRIVNDPNDRFKKNGFWNNPNTTSKKEHDMSWGRTESIADILNNAGSNNIQPQQDSNLSQADIEYWNKVREQSKNLEANLTDEQKTLLNQLNNAEFFPLTRLEDEN